MTAHKQDLNMMKKKTTGGSTKLLKPLIKNTRKNTKRMNSTSQIFTMIMMRKMTKMDKTNNNRKMDWKTMMITRLNHKMKLLMKADTNNMNNSILLTFDSSSQDQLIDC